MVQYVIDKGNTTVYQWKTGLVPQHVEVAELDLGLSDDEEDAKDKDDEVLFIHSFISFTHSLTHSKNTILNCPF